MRYMWSLLVCVFFIASIPSYAVSMNHPKIKGAKGAFKKDQVRYKRVRKAIVEKEDKVKKMFKELSIPFPAKIFFRAFKQEQKLELWALKNKTYTKVKTYKICMPSGTLGPKRQQGDLQVPEGFYYLNIFNPFSSYYLSLGVSYPNQADRILKTAKDSGGSIFVHGDCVTIGCLPMTDDIIKEIYYIALESKNKRYRIPIHIFPCDFKTKRCQKALKAFPKHQNFWKEIQVGYDIFETKKTLPKFWINKKGKYIFKK